MKLSPIILSAAVCASGQYLYQQQEPQSTARLRLQPPREQPANHRQRSAELSTEYFLQSNRDRQQQRARQPAPGADRSAQQRQQIASVVSVPAPSPGPNRKQQQQQPQLPTSPVLVTAGNHSPTHRQSPHDHRYQSQPLLRPQPWALPLVALSAAAMLLMVAFEIFVLLKARAAAPSRRHLFLGQALLLGLFLLAGLSAAASLTANPISCAAFRLVGLPAALVFAALLVKCVFLLSLNSGVYLPAPYQALVLMFAVLVQVAIVGQWLYGEPNSLLLVNASRLNTTCGTPLSESLAALGYPGLLLLAVTCLAVRARGVHDNYRESWFIGLAVGLVLPVWLASAIGSLLAAEPEREAWLSFGLLSTSILVFLAMFLPKGRQLAALGREAAQSAGHLPITVASSHHQRHHHHHHPQQQQQQQQRDRRDDCDDQLSNYSPSFFHFKPPPESSLKRKLPQHYHSADRVALVSSCNACRHAASPVYSDATSASNFDHMPYIHGPMETFVLPPGMYLRPEDTGNLYTTLSANPNVFFQRAHPGMMY